MINKILICFRIQIVKALLRFFKSILWNICNQTSYKTLVPLLICSDWGSNIAIIAMRL